MSVRSRLAFGSGAAGAVGAALLLSGRYEGSVVLAVLLAFSIRTASLAALVDAGPILAAGAVRGLRARAWIAPAWTLAVAAAILRSGSGSLGDVRGVNAVAGSALAYGPLPTVVGSWLAFGAAALALMVWSPLGAETAGRRGAAGRVVVPGPVARLEGIGVIAEAAVVVTLFAGPQVADASDAAWWIGGIGVLAAGAWLARRRKMLAPASMPAICAAAAALGAMLVFSGGRP